MFQMLSIKSWTFYRSANPHLKSLKKCWNHDSRLSFLSFLSLPSVKNVEVKVVKKVVWNIWYFSPTFSLVQSKDGADWKERRRQEGWGREQEKERGGNGIREKERSERKKVEEIQKESREKKGSIQKARKKHPEAEKKASRKKERKASRKQRSMNWDEGEKGGPGEESCCCTCGLWYLYLLAVNNWKSRGDLKAESEESAERELLVLLCSVNVTSSPSSSHGRTWTTSSSHRAMEPESIGSIRTVHAERGEWKNCPGHRSLKMAPQRVQWFPPQVEGRREKEKKKEREGEGEGSHLSQPPSFLEPPADAVSALLTLVPLLDTSSWYFFLPYLLSLPSQESDPSKSSPYLLQSSPSAFSMKKRISSPSLILSWYIL